MNITPKNNPGEFSHFLFKEIDLGQYKYKFLSDYLNKAIEGVFPLYDLSVINISQSGWLTALHGDMLLIYGEAWDKNQFQELREIFDLNKFTNYTLSGDNDLIESLIEFYKPKNFEVEKRRLMYQATEVKIVADGDLKIRKGLLEELDELAKMLQEYYHEEYLGLNDKSIDEMRKRIFSIIQTNSIYVLLDKHDRILSFCTIIDPDIGILFTKTEHRNNGYGKIILSYCSNLLWQRNGIVYLMTDRDRPASNNVCKAIGFKEYYQYSMVKINCG